MKRLTEDFHYVDVVSIGLETVEPGNGMDSMVAHKTVARVHAIDFVQLNVV